MGPKILSMGPRTPPYIWDLRYFELLPMGPKILRTSPYGTNTRNEKKFKCILFSESMQSVDMESPNILLIRAYIYD